MPFGETEILIAVVILVLIVIIYVLTKPASAPADPSVGDKSAEQGADNDSPKPTFNIFFGSQSGNAESYAEELRDEAIAYGLKAKVVDLEEYDPEELEMTDFCVFLVATFGEGEPTDNAVTFWEWLHDDDSFEDDKFEKLTYSVFALGNRQWEHFCNVGIVVDQKLSKYGGNKLLDLGMGDDDGSMEADFAEWKTNFWAATKDHFGVEEDTTEREVVVPFKVKYTRHPNDPSSSETESKDVYDTKFSQIKTGIGGFMADEKFKARLVKVSENRELRSDTFEGNTRHIELELPSSLRYQTADNLGLFSHNDFKNTGKIIRRLGLHPKTILQVVGTSSSFKSVFPKFVTVQDALLLYCDFASVPRASAIKNMAYYVSDPVQKAQLKAYALDKDKKAEFARDHKNWLELLEEFPALNLPFDVFLHMVPKLSPYPRYYTISSSSKVQPRTASITVTVGPTQLPNNRVYNGICSTYILNQGLSENVSAFIRPSTFRLPAPSKPVIMFGPGTGVAPFRAFWHEARWLKAKGTSVQDWHLFFGCRYESKDFIYKEEMTDLKSLGISTHFAFSRDRKEKTYVQDLLKDEKLGAEIWNLIKNKGAHMYVCGASSMGRSVREAVVNLAERHGNLSSAEGEVYVKQLLEVKKTYIQELWS